MKQAFNFSIKVWLTAVFVAPAAIIGLLTLQHDYNLTSWFAYGMSIIVGTVYSIPSVLILWLVAYQLSKYIYQQINLKALLLIAGFILTLFATGLCFRHLPSAKDEVFFTEVYVGVILGGMCLYKLKPVLHNATIEAQS